MTPITKGTARQIAWASELRPQLIDLYARTANKTSQSGRIQLAKIEHVSECDDAAMIIDWHKGLTKVLTMREELAIRDEFLADLNEWRSTHPEPEDDADTPPLHPNPRRRRRVRRANPPVPQPTVKLDTPRERFLAEQYDRHHGERNA